MRGNGTDAGDVGRKKVVGEGGNGNGRSNGNDGGIRRGGGDRRDVRGGRGVAGN